jgi:hypothetical protein
VTFKEMLMANSKMVDTLAQLLFEKGLFTEEEFYEELRQSSFRPFFFLALESHYQ